MEVKAIQSNCLDTLVVVDQICKRHNLRYYLVGGTGSQHFSGHSLSDTGQS